MLKLLNLLLLKLLIVVGYYVLQFIKAVESIFVEDVDCCRLHYVLYRALVLSKLLNLWLLKLLIVVGYYIL